MPRKRTPTGPIAPLSASCPACGSVVQAGGRGRGRVFCTTECKKRFGQASKLQGAPILLPFLTWMETRHAKPGTPEADLCREARREATAIARLFLTERAAAGMPAASGYFATLVRDGERYMDRRRVGSKRKDDSREDLALGDLFDDMPMPSMIGHNGPPVDGE